MASRRGQSVEALSERTVVATAEDQICADLAGGVVILHLGSSMYYGLDAVGARIWTLLQEPRTVGEIRDVLLEEFDVERHRCEQDLLDLLRQLAAHDLVEVKNGP